MYRDLPTWSQARKEAARYCHHVHKTPLLDLFPITFVQLDPLVTTKEDRLASLVPSNEAYSSSTVPSPPAASPRTQIPQSHAPAAASTGQPVTTRYFLEEHAEEWSVVTSRVPGKIRSWEPMTSKRLPFVSQRPSGFRAVILSDVPLLMSSPPNVSQPASRAIQFPKPISRSITFVNCAASSLFVQPYISFPLLNLLPTVLGHQQYAIPIFAKVSLVPTKNCTTECIHTGYVISHDLAIMRLLTFVV